MRSSLAVSGLLHPAAHTASQEVQAGRLVSASPSSPWSGDTSGYRWRAGKLEERGKRQVHRMVTRERAECPDEPDWEERPDAGSKFFPNVKKHHHKHNLKHRYQLLETLGCGACGKVKKAQERATGRIVSRVGYNLTHLTKHLTLLWKSNLL